MNPGLSFALRAAAALALAAVPAIAAAQQVGPGRWADAGDPVAKQLIEYERQWATLSCTPSNVIAEFMADDFVGTHPRGMTYTSADVLAHQPDAKAPPTERDCKLLSAKVRYYGADIAIIYGSESAIAKGPDGAEAMRKLVWTDTVLRRAGKWQVIAVQDMVVPAQ